MCVLPQLKQPGGGGDSGGGGGGQISKSIMLVNHVATGVPDRSLVASVPGIW